MWKVLFFLFWLNIVSYATWYKIENKDDFGDSIYAANVKSECNKAAIIVMIDGEFAIGVRPNHRIEDNISIKFDTGEKYYLNFKREKMAEEEMDNVVYIRNFEVFNMIRKSKSMKIIAIVDGKKEILKFDNTGSNKIIRDVIGGE